MESSRFRLVLFSYDMVEPFADVYLVWQLAERKMRFAVPFSIMINQDIKCSFLLVWSQILSLCAGFLVFFFAGLTIDVWLFCVGPDDMYLLILRVEGVSSRFLFSGLCKLEWFVVHWDLLILFWSFLNMQCIVWNYLYSWILFFGCWYRFFVEDHVMLVTVFECCSSQCDFARSSGRWFCKGGSSERN